MGTYAQAYDIIWNLENTSTPVEQGRCRYSISESARDVQNESASVTNHTLRIKWADKWLSANIDTPFSYYMTLIIENATIYGNMTTTAGDTTLGDTTDNDLKFVTDGLVNDFADLP